MTCPREERWAVYVDGETTGEEASALQAHLRTCSRCGSVVEALSAESRLLAGVLEEAVLPGEAVARAGWRDLGTAALGIAAAVAGLDALAGWVSGLLQEGPLRVLDPQAAAVSLLFEVFFYLLREGASMLASIQTVIAVVAVLLAGAFLTLLWRRRMPLGPFLLLAGSLVSAGSATALERRVARDDSESIVVRAGETVDDSLLAAGETVSVDGVVTGNLVACARRVTVRGSVQGDLIVAAQEVDLDGTVEGNVMGFAQELKQRGRVE
ncbi:MAG TPA: zf-HC2 domain-containing protein, partial [Vicinamibacteria bacterium]